MKTRAVVRIYGGLSLLGIALLVAVAGYLFDLLTDTAVLTGVAQESVKDYSTAVYVFTAVLALFGLFGFVAGVIGYVTAAWRQLSKEPIHTSRKKYSF